MFKKVQYIKRCGNYCMLKDLVDFKNSKISINDWFQDLG